MKKIVFFIAALASVATASAQNDVNIKMYGRVRSEVMLNSRQSQESVDGLFYMFPLDEQKDANGDDINAAAQSNMYVLYTRLGMDLSGPKIGTATATAKVEMDFRGGSTNYSMIRVRQAYVNLDWDKKHALLIGQTWHPLTGDVTPSMLNLSTGAPYQPFSRTPMIRYRENIDGGLQFTAAAMWQMQYNSTGPDGKSFKYLKNSCVPEVYLGLDYKKNGLQAGVGVDMISLAPRQTATGADGKTYKVSERATSLSAEAHVKYATKDWSIAAKNVYGSNLAHASMLGGYAVSDTDAKTGEQEYTPYRVNSTWVNFVYGKKWQPGVFVGYAKNLGATKDIKGDKYGTGLNIDQLASVNATLTYNIPHWKVGLELEPTIAWYGDKFNARGKAESNHSVTNFRALAVAMYIF